MVHDYKVVDKDHKMSSNVLILASLSLYLFGIAENDNLLKRTQEEITFITSEAFYPVFVSNCVILQICKQTDNTLIDLKTCFLSELPRQSEEQSHFLG